MHTEISVLNKMKVFTAMSIELIFIQFYSWKKGHFLYLQDTVPLEPKINIHFKSMQISVYFSSPSNLTLHSLHLNLIFSYFLLSTQSSSLNVLKHHLSHFFIYSILFLHESTLTFTLWYCLSCMLGLHIVH